MPPDTLLSCKDTVIVASKLNSKSIIEQLRNEYNINDIYVFGIINEQIDLREADEYYPENAISIRFYGGLGNQMFQYAVLSAFRSKGKRIYARNMNLNNSLEIAKVFPQVRVNEITKKNEEEIIPFNVKKDAPNTWISYYKENLSQGTIKRANLDLLEMNCGIIQGVFQTCFFAEMVREELLKDFSFPLTNSDKLSGAINEMRACNSVAVHIRRGDYLIGNNKYLYGDICTEDYYNNAMGYIRKRVKAPVFFVFSNDIDGARKIIVGDDIRFVDGNTFDDYEDWYDMYMMSQCKHNIIANSTFSWWGAWLNRNDGKIVIAPNKWVNTLVYEDIYPEDWIVIS